MTNLAAKIRGGDVFDVAAPAANPIMISGKWRYGWLWGAIWVLYLAGPAAKAWQLPELARRIAGLTTLGLFAVAYIGTFVLLRSRRLRGRMISRPVSWLLLAVLAVLGIGVMTVLGQPGIGVLVYLSVMAIFLLPPRAAWTSVAAILVASLVAPKLISGWRVDGVLTFQIFVAALAVWGIARIIERNGQLAAAREEIARLAVANERNRFARDLHDLLGHTLTVVTVKAELAGRLVSLAPERAEAEIADIERLSRQALADVRTAVSGYRDVSLAVELASARTALDAAGIEADLPGAVEKVPAERNELFGWAVREAVTNVVRHSGAKRCRVRITPDEVEVTDDGTGPTGGTGGTGLAGLRERAEAIGGTLTVGRAAEGGFSLRVRV
jgi:two-component system sensor histidine kinase DesK